MSADMPDWKDETERCLRKSQVADKIRRALTETEFDLLKTSILSSIIRSHTRGMSDARDILR